MPSHVKTNNSALPIAYRSMRFMLLLLAGISYGVANAAPLPPPPDYNADTGSNYFVPNDTVIGIELLDVLEPLTTFGFYFQGDSGTLIPIFDGADSGGDQVAAIDFINGIVIDIDVNPSVAEAGFITSANDIGFFLSIGSTNIFSDPALNGGLDLFSAFQSQEDGSLWWMIFEGVNPDGSLAPINMNLVAGISAVPLPPALLLFGSVLPLLAFMRKRKSAA
ncbi:MAG: hypothetical protein OES26_27005 [Gammaproteobacteria bacterium]|nr:hypothetical protein [Gammaproteobacteria bacterium]